MKKNKNVGFKAMLRDRLPKTTNLALKWCSAKEKWINYVYETYLSFIADKSLRKEICRNILGLSHPRHGFLFMNTIAWKDLTPEDRNYWDKISKNVAWFEGNMLPIAESYKMYLRLGDNDEEIKAKIMFKFMQRYEEPWKEKLYNYIITHIKQYYV